jgi:glycosyltransferase involved in cell wall biosynthesis
MPAVTAITIFRDAEAFLGEAVASVLAQTWSDWELLLVDDGSQDGSGPLARTLADRHPGRIRYLTIRAEPIAA